MITCGIDSGSRHLGLCAIGDVSALAELVGHVTLRVGDGREGREQAAAAALAWAIENSAERIAIEWTEDLWGDPMAHTHVMRAQALAERIDTLATAAGIPVTVYHRQTALAYVRRVAALVPGCPALPVVVGRGVMLEPVLAALVTGWGERERAPIVGEQGRPEHEADACVVALAEMAQRAGVRLASGGGSRAARRARRRARAAAGPPPPRAPSRDVAAERLAARAAVRAAAGCVCKPGGGHGKGCALYVPVVKWCTERVRAERARTKEGSGDG